MRSDNVGTGNILEKASFVNLVDCMQASILLGIFLYV